MFKARMILRGTSLILISFLISNCQTKEKWHTSTLLFFDTVCELKVFCSPSRFKSAQEEVHRLFSEIQTLFSPASHDYSSPMVLPLYHRSLEIYHQTDGCFDITVSPLSRAWGFFDASYRVPSPQEIKSLLGSVGMEKIKEKNGTLILIPGMKLDWGGIAKGFAIDLAYEALMKMGIKNGFLNAGGDLFCWGENPEKKKWRIGIKHPRKRGNLGVISISGLGAATTGDYQRFFIKEGIRYHHVFDPSTGYPVQGKQSVTVIGPETLVCDALSTALFVSKQPEKIIQHFSDYGAYIVAANGKITGIGKKYPFSF